MIKKFGSYMLDKVCQFIRVVVGTLRCVLEGRTKLATGNFKLGPKNKMAVKLLEIAITLLLYHLGIKFQLLYLCFHGWPTRRNNNRHGKYYHTTKIQYGGYKTGSSFNSGYIPLRIEIPTAITMFLRGCQHV